MKKVWITTELFFPDENATAFIMTHIANALSEYNEVNVICGPSDYAKQPRHSTAELDSRVNVCRVSGVKLNKNNILSRVLRFLILTIKLSYALMKRVHKGDKILVVTNPATILLTVAWIKKLREAELYLLVHDVFPENTVPAGIIKSPNSLFYKILKTIFNWAYSAADKLIVLGRDMKDVIKEKIGGDRAEDIIIIENWGETVSIIPKNNVSHASEVRLQYAGNLGRVQGLMELLSCIYEADNPVLSYEFWGDGAVKKDIERYIQDNNLSGVSLKGAYARDEQDTILASCDIAIVTLADGMYGLGVPSKTYNILAAGKPILFIGDVRSEIALLIKENNIGYVFDKYDTKTLILFLKGLTTDCIPELKEKGKRARMLAEKSFSEEKIMAKYIELFK